MTYARFEDLPVQISNLKSSAESCSRQLRAWAGHLRNSDIEGQRHLTGQSKQHYHFQKRLLESLPPDHPERKRRLKQPTFTPLV